jgi:hypothetical protein
MNEFGLTTREIVRLLVKHGEQFVCCKERASVSYLDCGAPERRIASSGVAMRKQIDSADFTVRVSLHGFVKPANEKGIWSVFLNAKFAARSIGGARRSDMIYEVVGPTPAQLLAFHQSDQVALASKVKKLGRKRTIKTRTDIL